MGLEDFSTSSSSSSGGSDDSSSLNNVRSVDPEDLSNKGPFFNVVVKKIEESVHCFKGDGAFERSERHKDEKYLCRIDTEEEFDKINGRCEELHDCSIEELFKKDPVTASDFVSRVSHNKPGEEEVECSVCGDTITVTVDNYTKVDGEIVHAGHRVDEVVEELDIGE